LSSEPPDMLFSTDIDVIIHAAAYVKMTGQFTDFQKINSLATGQLLECGSKNGCSRFIYISSTSVHGFGDHLETKENGPYYPLASSYQRTKRDGENLVTSFRHEKMKTTVLRPGLVYGPGDSTTLKPVFKLIDSGRLPMLGRFDVYSCPIYIDDLVDAVILAIEKPEAEGELFNITSGERILLRDALFRAAELLDRPPPKLNIPVAAASAAAIFLEFAYKVLPLPGELLITRYLAAELGTNFHFSPEKAESLLGFSAKVSLEEGLSRAVRAYRIERPPNH
ncbi:MAG: NAD-dependent epimerase/dehydratase family protein, partial [Spirochaetales bacterium]|nr:NAD-dependent epimerase/dehydratase family protein [Spirochaetales bacterium]